MNYVVTSSNQEFVDFFEAEANTISTLDEEWLNNFDVSKIVLDGNNFIDIEQINKFVKMI